MSPLTIGVYRNDVRQFLDYLTSTNSLLSHVNQITQDDIHGYPG